jgi:arylsulfatase A-like enzyme
MRLILVLCALLGIGVSCVKTPQAQGKPNILWITCEDISPYLGSYGDPYALTPNLDQLAKEGIRYIHAYANAPVCGVARSTLLTGLYATTTGTHHMRARTSLPEQIPAYPAILRDAGYYCTNNVKTDYNSSYESKKETLWDECSKQAHWKNRPEGTPFFAVFNITVTHESQLSADAIRGYLERNQIPDQSRIRPEEIRLPPYHPDLPEIRNDWVRYHDLITLMDQMVGELLKEVEEAGLTENTIVVFNSDHGGHLSRSKRYIYNVGTQVPLIIYLPEKWQHLSRQKAGTSDSRLVSFIDFPKTFLSICGSEVPASMQGSVFLGPNVEKEPDYIHFYRDRMGSRSDFSRAVTDGRYYLIRNFNPHRPRGRDSRYGYWVQANWGAWEEHYNAGFCNDLQSQFYEAKPALELFDTQNDPWHINNLAGDPAQAERLQILSENMDRWMLDTRDAGLIPESMFADLAGEGIKHATLYEFTQSSDYPIRKILEAAKSASEGLSGSLETYIGYAKDKDPILRYWGIYGLFRLQNKETNVLDVLRSLATKDPFASNRLMAAQALGVCGDSELAFETIYREALQTRRGFVFLQTINAFQYSLTDDRLKREDWEKFKSISESLGAEGDPFGPEYALRIINDALDLWPERRKVY